MFWKTGKVISLSEQNLNCSQPQGNQGYNGGLMDYAFQYIKEMEAWTPRTPILRKHRMKAISTSLSLQLLMILDLWISLSPKSPHEGSDHYGGPISAASFQFYKSGIYYDPDCSSKDHNHGILVVG